MTAKPISHSPFFRLESKRKLANLLGLSVKEIQSITKVLKTNPSEYYHVFTMKQQGKSRQVEEPIGILKGIHSRIKDLFARTEVPTWLISGQKGKNITDNARPHIPANFVTCVDIEKFYKHVARERVYQMFLYTFQTSPDVAFFLTELVMFQDVQTGHCFIPTGSPCSQVVAFWAYYHTFNDIADYVTRLGVTMTLYVDDLTLSFSRLISSRIINNIHNRLKSVGLSFKLSKIKHYGPSHYKVVTGNCITPGHQLIPTRKLRHDISKMVNNQNLDSFTLKQLRSLNGKIAATHLQDPTMFLPLYGKTRKILKQKMASNKPQSKH
ncbi:reverse transcriptase family protein [Candidatus Proelusimicrobium volucris]|uniref:reverse transcriptase family protein n=1 Tax=Candidatus Proelusimicrobium volucris TaxID=3416225 RepID=UPI003D0A9856